MFAVIGLRHQDAHVLPEDFIGRVAEQADTGLVERLDDAVAVDGDQAVDHSVEHRVDQAAQPGLAGLDHSLRGGALGDVSGDLAEAAQRAVGRPDGGDHHVGEETRAVLANTLAEIREAAGSGGVLKLALWHTRRDILRRVEA